MEGDNMFSDGQSLIKCTSCSKEFIYFGAVSDSESYFCSPDCVGHKE